MEHNKKRDFFPNYPISIDKQHIKWID